MLPWLAQCGAGLQVSQLAAKFARIQIVASSCRNSGEFRYERAAMKLEFRRTARGACLLHYGRRQDLVFERRSANLQQKRANPMSHPRHEDALSGHGKFFCHCANKIALRHFPAIFRANPRARGQMESILSAQNTPGISRRLCITGPSRCIKLARAQLAVGVDIPADSDVRVRNRALPPTEARSSAVSP